MSFTPGHVTGLVKIIDTATDSTRLPPATCETAGRHFNTVWDFAEWHCHLRESGRGSLL